MTSFPSDILLNGINNFFSEVAKGNHKQGL